MWILSKNHKTFEGKPLWKEATNSLKEQKYFQGAISSMKKKTGWIFNSEDKKYVVMSTKNKDWWAE